MDPHHDKTKLSELEQRLLEQIEHGLTIDHPGLAVRLTGPVSSWRRFWGGLVGLYKRCDRLYGGVVVWLICPTFPRLRLPRWRTTMKALAIIAAVAAGLLALAWTGFKLAGQIQFHAPIPPPDSR